MAKENKLGRVPKGTFDRARQELSDLFFRQSAWTDKQLAVELHRLGYVNKFKVPNDPTDKTIRRWLSNIRKQQQSAIYKALEEVYDPVHSNSNPVLRAEDITFNNEERMWLSEMSAKLDVWFFRTLGIKESKFKVRDAIWSCKLLNVAPELFESLRFIDIYLWAVAYSTKERLAEFSGEELDTTSEDLYFTHKAYLGGMNYQQFETIRKDRDLGMPFYDPRSDLALAVDVELENVRPQQYPEIKGEDATRLNKLVETIINAYSDLEPWQKIPFIFGATISEHPYVMPSVNLQEFLCTSLDSMINDARAFPDGLWGEWIEKEENEWPSNPKTNSTKDELQRRRRDAEQLIDDAQKNLSIDSFVIIDIDLDKLMFVVGDAFDSLITFSNLLEPYIKSEPFNVGEVTTLNARASTDENNVFGWHMMFEKFTGIPDRFGRAKNRWLQMHNEKTHCRKCKHPFRHCICDAKQSED